MTADDICMTPSSSYSQLPATAPRLFEEGALQGRPVSTVEKGISVKQIGVAIGLIVLIGALCVAGGYLIGLGTPAGIIGGVLLLLAGLAIAYCATTKASKSNLPKLTGYDPLRLPVALHSYKGEDRHLAIRYHGEGGEKFDLVGVFDGHGGAGVAEFVQCHLPETFQRHFNDSGNPAVAFRKAFEELDGRAKEIAKNEVEGATATVSFICCRTGEVVTATLGDSEARVLSPQRGLGKLSEVVDWMDPREQARIGAQPGKRGVFVVGDIRIVPPSKHFAAKSQLTLRGQKTEKNPQGFVAVGCSRGMGHGGRVGEIISPIPLVRYSQLEAGERLLLFTDGLGDRLVGTGSVANFLDHINSATAQTTATSSLSFVTEPHDDTTIMVYDLAAQQKKSE